MWYSVVPIAVRFALVFRWIDSILVELKLIWGVYAACGGDYNPKCAASCSVNRFLLCFGGAVEVRIVIYLSVLERWRKDSRLK